MTYKLKNTPAPNPIKTNVTSSIEMFFIELFVSGISLGFAYYSWGVGAIVAVVSSSLLGFLCLGLVLWTTKNYISDVITKKNPPED